MHFILVPDSAAARRVRRAVAEKTNGLGVVVGTVGELVSLLRASWLVPEPGGEWAARLDEEIAAVGGAFWLKSYEAAPRETREAVGRALELVLTAAGPGVGGIEVPEGLSPRLKTRLKDLARLHEAMGRTLPEELAVRRMLLDVPQDQMIRRVHVYAVEGLPEMSPWDKALLERVAAHADESARRRSGTHSDGTLEGWKGPLGAAGARVEGSGGDRRSRSSPGRSGSKAAPANLPGGQDLGTGQGRRGDLEKILEDWSGTEPGANAASSLGRLQRELFSDSAEFSEPDQTVCCLGVRDAAEEVEVAAQMLQAALAGRQGIVARDFALLLPDDPLYHSLVHEVFAEAGLPVAGLRIAERRRPVGWEAVHLFVAALQKPASPMAVAALCELPVMPWDAEAGRDLVASTLRYMQAPRPPEGMSEDGKWLLRKLRSGATDADSLRKAVAGFKKVAEALPPDAGVARGEMEQAIATCLKLLAGRTEIPWDELLHATSAAPLEEEVRPDVTQEAIAVFSEGREPWRKIDHLLVLGFSDGHYPAAGAVSRVFSETDLAELSAAGLKVATRAEERKRGRMRFLRQLGAATGSATFLVPQCNFAGEPLAASESLSWMARLLTRDSQPASLLRLVDRVGDLDAVPWVTLPEAVAAPPKFVPEKKDLELGMDLTRRWSQRDEPQHESPSRLEKLLVSPLAWLLERADMTPGGWSAPEFDVKTKGTLAHSVFERLFNPDENLRSAEEIRNLVPGLLDRAIEAKAPPLSASEWALQRSNLIAEIEAAALKWNELLRAVDARVVATELAVSGQFDGVPIQGRTDVVLLLPDGRLLVADYKKSSSRTRRKRMRAGYDSQASLYVRMLKSGECGKCPENLEQALRAKGAVGAIYFTLNDEVALLGGIQARDLDARGFEVVGADVSGKAMELLSRRVADLKKGLVQLPRVKEIEMLDKEGSLSARYVLEDSPLLGLFQVDEEVKA